MLATLVFALAVAESTPQDASADYKQYYEKYMSTGGQSGDAAASYGKYYDKYMNKSGSDTKFLDWKAHSDPAILGLRGNMTALRQKLAEVEHAKETVQTYVPKDYQGAPLAQAEKDEKDLRAMIQEAEKAKSESDGKTEAKTGKAHQENATAGALIALVGTDSVAAIEKKIKEVEGEEKQIKTYVPAAYQAGALKAAKKELAGLEKAKKGAEEGEKANATHKNTTLTALIDMPLAEVEKKEAKKEEPAKKEEAKKEEAKKEEPAKKEEAKKEEPAKKTCWHYFFCGDDLAVEQSQGTSTSTGVLFLCAVVVAGAQLAISRRRARTINPEPLLG